MMVPDAYIDLKRTGLIRRSRWYYSVAWVLKVGGPFAAAHGRRMLCAGCMDSDSVGMAFI